MSRWGLSVNPNYQRLSSSLVPVLQCTSLSRSGKVLSLAAKKLLSFLCSLSAAARMVQRLWLTTRRISNLSHQSWQMKARISSLRLIRKAEYAEPNWLTSSLVRWKRKIEVRGWRDAHSYCQLIRSTPGMKEKETSSEHHQGLCLQFCFDESRPDNP